MDGNAKSSPRLSDLSKPQRAGQRSQTHKPLLTLQGSPFCHFGETTEAERRANLVRSVHRIEARLRELDDEGQQVFTDIQSEEVWLAIQWLKKNRSGGIDGLVAEVLQNLQEPEVDTLTELLNAKYKGDASSPLEWLWTKVLLIAKCGFPQTVGDFRPVSFSNTIQKVYFKILLRRLQLHLPANPYKSFRFGNRKAAMATEVTQTLRLIFELANNFDKPVGLDAKPEYRHSRGERVIAGGRPYPDGRKVPMAKEVRSLCSML